MGLRAGRRECSAVRGPCLATRPPSRLRLPPRPPALAPQPRAGGRQVGSIAIKSFTARAQRDVAAAVAELEARGATELELDLRDNRWGAGGGAGAAGRDSC